MAAVPTAPAGPAASAVRFGDVQRLLALFAQGLSGRSLHLKPREAPGAPVRTHTAPAERESLHLPAEIGFFASHRHNLGAYRIAVLHQLGYLGEGTFDFDLAVAEKRFSLPFSAAPAGAQESLAARLARRLPLRVAMPDLERFFAAAARPVLLRRVFFALEDLRIDTVLRARYPGARADLDRVLAQALASRPPLDARRGLAALLETLVRFSLGADRDALASHDATGLAGPMLVLAQRVLDADATVYDSAAAALEICGLLETLFRRSARRRDPGVESIDDGLPETRQGDDAASGPAPADGEGEAEPSAEDFDIAGVEFRGELRSIPPARHARGGQPGGVPLRADAPGTEAARGNGESTAEDVASARRLRSIQTQRAMHREPKSFLYDEWDCHSRTYLRSWCRVHEQRLRGEDFEFIDALRRRTAELAGEVRRQFSQIRPESWRRVHHANEGDELELDAVIDAVIDRRNGRATDENLYVRRDRGLREVAAAFLVDMSASTDFPIPDPATKPSAKPPESVDHDPYLWGRYGGPLDLSPSAPRRRVIDVARESLALMCDALHRLGDSHAVYGFSGSGRENVEFSVIKGFEEPLSARSWAALAAMEPRRSTRMGPAIRHTTAKLARQPLRRKVMIIVSDGYPEDEDYGPDRRDREYGILDTARALEEAERAGITTFCITIDPAGNDYLRRMCPGQRYLVIDDVAALPAELTKVYRALTRAGGSGSGDEFLNIGTAGSSTGAARRSIRISKK